jgi:Bacteriophage tail sheath protein
MTGSKWTYVLPRRLALFLEESLQRGTQWAVFEPNREPTGARLVSISKFMPDTFNQGAFAGTTPDEGF